MGRLSLDASPSAEVFIGDLRLGQTPLRDVALPAGTHRVVLRHPEVGERSTTLVIREQARTTLAVDMGTR